MVRDGNARLSKTKANEIARSHSSGECWIETNGEVILLCRRGRNQRVELHPALDMTEDGIRSLVDWVLNE